MTADEKQVQHDLLGRAGLHARRSGDHLGSGLHQDPVTGDLEEGRTGVVGKRDGDGSGLACGAQRADGEGGGSACGDPEHDVLPADPGVGHGRRAGFLVVLGTFDLDQRAEPTGHG